MMGGYFGFGFGWIFMFLFWGLVIWAILALVHGVAGRHGCCGGHNRGENENRKNNASEILKERYAKGEISVEEFEKMKKEIE